MHRHPPRALWIHQNFVSRGQAGNSRPVLVLAALLEAGWGVDLIAAQGSYLARSGGTAEDVVEDASAGGGLRIERLAAGAPDPDRARRGASYAAFLRAALATARGRPRPDLVYCSSPPLPQALPALLISIGSGAPLVFEVRDLWPAMLVETGLVESRVAVALLAWLEAATARYAALCVPVTPGLGLYFEVLGVPPEKLRTVPTGADPALQSPRPRAAAEWRERRGLGERFTVLYAGSMHAHYGVEEMLEAAALVHAEEPDVVWVFAGDGRDRGRVTAAAEAREYVRDVGPVPKTALAGALHGADAGIVSLSDLPMFRAAMPGKLGDYLAAGLPVISNVPGHPAAILEASAGGVRVSPRAGARALADAVLDLARRSPAERAAMGEAGRAWAAEHLDAERLARSLAAEVEAVRSAGARGGLRRALRSSVLAVGDVARGRSRAAAQALRGRGSDARIDAAMTRWLARSRAPADARPLAVPSILSPAASP